MDEKKKSNENRPKLGLKERFHFCCRPGLACFTKCCADVNIFLGPYDVLRLKNRLGMSSDEFLDAYTYILSTQNQIVPVVVLKMDESTPEKRCPFVTPEGCRVYEDRPWPCRMYPLDMDADEKFSIIADPDRCLGLQEDQDLRVIEWLEDQGVLEYQRAAKYFTDITDDPRLQTVEVANPQIKRMFTMASYNLDRFREFILETSFLDIFDLDEDTIEQLRVDDSELLHFGLNWIRFGLFGEKTLKIKPEVLEARQARRKKTDAEEEA
jgi:hypothetical protein